MIKASYEELVKLISNATKLDIAEIEKKVAEKKAKLSDLISREGAAQIVAAELGVSFDKQKVKANGLLVGMRKVSLIAKVIKMYPIRTFKTKTGESKVANMILADDTDTVKGVLWDIKQILQLEEGKIKEGDVVEINGGTVREGQYGKEIHLGSFAELKPSNEVLSNVVEFKPQQQSLPAAKKLNELKENDRATVRAVIVQAFEPKFFSVCPECGKKVTSEGSNSSCGAHGVVVPKERFLMSIVLDDGTANIRAVGFSEVVSKLFGVSEDAVKGLIDKKNDVLGKELFVTGRVRKNKMFDNLEFIISSVEDVDPEKLISNLSSP